MTAPRQPNPHLDSCFGSYCDGGDQTARDEKGGTVRGGRAASKCVGRSFGESRKISTSAAPLVNPSSSRVYEFKQLVGELNATSQQVKEWKLEAEKAERQIEAIKPDHATRDRDNVDKKNDKPADEEKK